ncbi:hypothetical protein BKA82DRAFT_3226678 [Pisolithus tinctorius]|nr:hypothetical protein BKA82DRAFT_3226678 [Pisolithus tinctorius]
MQSAATRALCSQTQTYQSLVSGLSSGLCSGPDQGVADATPCHILSTTHMSDNEMNIGEVADGGAVRRKDRGFHRPGGNDAGTTGGEATYDRVESSHYALSIDA